MKHIYVCLSVICAILGLEACSNRDDHKIDSEKTTNVTNSFSTIPFDNKIGVKADSQTVVVIPYFKNSAGETQGDPASGFVMNGRCLISSYHAFVKEGFGDPYKIIVLFKTRGIWDSTQAKFDRDFVFGKFSLKTHKWEVNKFSTDYIALPLEHSIPQYNVDVDAEETKQNEVFYVSGPPTIVNNQISPNSRKVVQVMQKTYFLDRDSSSYLGLVGYTGPGFSGAPVYNRQGYITGIVAEELNEEQLRQKLNDRIISQGEYNDIIKNIRSGVNLSVCISMKTIVKQYN